MTATSGEPKDAPIEATNGSNKSAATVCETNVAIKVENNKIEVMASQGEDVGSTKKNNDILRNKK